MNLIETPPEDDFTRTLKQAIRKMRRTDYIIEQISIEQSGDRVVLVLAPSADVKVRHRTRWFRHSIGFEDTAGINITTDQ